ncbi:MAG: FliA/WhiG family RNA polymerase sigma factor [Deltaproteobacteria bacterium]|nr:FliA/WhiG family RNA polymerase sigma factor [Deltaproteobacteria bacterium]
MRNGISKYRQQQEGGEEIPEAGSLLLAEALEETIEKVASEAGGALFEDQLVLSEEAAARLAEEALEAETRQAEEAAASKAVATAAAIAPPREKEKLGTREEIIRDYAPLIKYIAQKIAARLPANIELDDLISSGVIGLMDAIEKYDPSRDNKFKTYAEFRIRGAILDELRAQDWVPRSVREKAKMLERAYAKIEQDKGRPADDDEVCKQLNITREEYHALLAEVRSISLLSYDDLSGLTKGDKRGSIEFSESTRAPTPYAEVNSAHVKKVVAEAIKDLPEKQRLVLSLYYYEDLNLKEIGKVLDVTESRVSQLHTQAILRLKAKLKNHFDDFAAMFM